MKVNKNTCHLSPLRKPNYKDFQWEVAPQLTQLEITTIKLFKLDA